MSASKRPQPRLPSTQYVVRAACSTAYQPSFTSGASGAGAFFSGPQLPLPSV